VGRNVSGIRVNQGDPNGGDGLANGNGADNSFSAPSAAPVNYSIYNDPFFCIPINYYYYSGGLPPWDPGVLPVTARLWGAA